MARTTQYCPICNGPTKGKGASDPIALIKQHALELKMLMDKEKIAHISIGSKEVVITRMQDEVIDMESLWNAEIDRLVRF